ncbi:MAG TPA: HAMP domain-containing protein, partial [Gallionella sp.]|nr:HAMP domain-containing protein [Gallionella sp.]
MRISTRLLLLFLVVAVLPLALFSYLNLQQDEVTLRAESLGRMSGLADKKALQVKSYLAERVQDVRFLVHDSRVMAAGGIMGMERSPERLASAAYARENAALHRYFERYVDETAPFYDVFLISPQGDVFYTQRHEADFATNLEDGPYRNTQLAQAFRTSRMTLEPVISGYEYYQPSQAPALFITAPIMVDGRFEGMFAVQLGNELFLRVATDATGLGQSGEVTFAQLDGDGVLYTTPLKYRDDAAMKFRLSMRELKSVPTASALTGNSGNGVGPDYRGVQVVSAWRYLPELDWGMVVKMDADEVFASIATQREVTLEALLGLLVFAGLVAFFFGRQISYPLRALARTADEVAAGDLGKRVDEAAPGELGLFARAFNRMAENLQSLYRSLEDRVEERTRELNVSNEQLQEEVTEREYVEAALRDNQIELQRNQDLLNEAQRLGQIGSWELDLASGELRWSD